MIPGAASVSRGAASAACRNQLAAARPYWQPHRPTARSSSPGVVSYKHHGIRPSNTRIAPADQQAQKGNARRRLVPHVLLGTSGQSASEQPRRAVFPQEFEVLSVRSKYRQHLAYPKREGHGWPHLSRHDDRATNGPRGPFRITTGSSGSTAHTGTSAARTSSASGPRGGATPLSQLESPVDRPPPEAI